MNKTLLTAYLRTLAAKAIPELERKAMEWYLRHGDVLRDKRELALDYAMQQYAQATARIPVLAATTLDDQTVRQLLRQALDSVWTELDDRIKQAARDVTGQPAQTEADAKAASDMLRGGDDALGRPATADDFRPSFGEKPLD